MPLIYDKKAEAFIDAPTPLISVEGGVWQDSVGRAYQKDAWVDVWPTQIDLIENGILNTAISSFNSSIYFNAATTNTTQQASNNASFSQSDGYFVFSCRGINNVEARGFLVSTGWVVPAGQKKLVIECISDCTDYGAHVRIGAITDSNYENLIKNTKRYYRGDNVEYAFTWEYLLFGPSGIKPTSILTSYELDIAEIASEKLHLCIHATASGMSSYYANVRIKNMFLS